MIRGFPFFRLITMRETTIFSSVGFTCSRSNANFGHFIQFPKWWMSLINISTTLDHGFNLDRDYFVNISRMWDFLLNFIYIYIVHIRVRHIYWPISVFLINPFLIFVLYKRTQMSTDCKTAYIAHHVRIFAFLEIQRSIRQIILLCFDFYNGFLYQMYPLAPLPIFFCFGVLCTEDVSSRLLLVS